jgi:hypothetical protein
MSRDPRDDALSLDAPDQIVIRPISCEECHRPWLDRSERWRVYIAELDPPLTVPYCPQCAQREFGRR